MKNNKTLALFTSSYPYGSSETFLEIEIIYLSKSFEKVYILPYFVEEKQRILPSNVEVIDNIYDDNYSQSSIIRLYGLQIFKILFIELRKGQMFHREINHTISLLFRLFDKSRSLERWISSLGDSDSMIFYSYWFTEWSTILSILKSKGVIKKYFARSHGYDLYEYRTKYGFIPFRDFQLKYIDKLILISQDGLDYISHKYPRYRDKYLLHRLGTEDMGINDFQPKDHIVILSISNIVPVKRVELIIEILSNVNSKVKWIHFGGGELYDSIKTKANKLPNNIEYEMKGSVPNSDIYKFLQNNSIDIFINVSYSEGIPVSIMEAISFGIPVIATAVGGVPEIVNEQTGILIEREFDIDMVSDMIDNLRSNHIYSKNFRYGAREFWKEEYNSQLNYINFITNYSINYENTMVQ